MIRFVTKLLVITNILLLYPEIGRSRTMLENNIDTKIMKSISNIVNNGALKNDLQVLKSIYNNNPENTLGEGWSSIDIDATTLPPIEGVTFGLIDEEQRVISLNCGLSQLTSLDIDGLTAITMLSCYDNQLTSLDLSKNKMLTKLNCSKNQLSSLILEDAEMLTDLHCYENQLTTLDLSKNHNLRYLACYSNKISTLNLEYNIVLEKLHCYNNQLTSLTLGNTKKLSLLTCDYNQLTSLDLSKNKMLNSFSSHDNPFTKGSVKILNSLWSAKHTMSPMVPFFISPKKDSDVYTPIP